MDRFDTDFEYMIRLASATDGYEYLDEARNRWAGYDFATRWSSPNAARAALFARMVAKDFPLESLGKYEIVRRKQVEAQWVVDPEGQVAAIYLPEVRRYLSYTGWRHVEPIPFGDAAQLNLYPEDTRIEIRYLRQGEPRYGVEVVDRVNRG